MIKICQRVQDFVSFKENWQNKLQEADKEIQSLKDQLLNTSMNTSSLSRSGIAGHLTLPQ